MKTFLVAAAVFLLAGLGVAQINPGGASGAPSAHFPAHDLHQQIAQLVAEAKDKGGSGAMLGDYGSYRIQLSVRARSGGAEVHAHWNDVIVVEKGRARLITGGTVVGGESKADGETVGTKIEGGQSHELGPGDVFTVRAGTPHQTLVSPGVIYAVVVVKIREQ
ncbi:MAG TPA: hypothetical protein VGG42_09110 [Acidobacteriaceae bacterium]